tara:strand:+ start:96 stop:245 length:150 start_codon:yes stop_codon:yes gene_type:complete
MSDALAFNLLEQNIAIMRVCFQPANLGKSCQKPQPPSLKLADGERLTNK